MTTAVRGDDLACVLSELFEVSCPLLDVYEQKGLFCGLRLVSGFGLRICIFAYLVCIFAYFCSGLTFERSFGDAERGGAEESVLVSGVALGPADVV